METTEEPTKKIWKSFHASNPDHDDINADIIAASAMRVLKMEQMGMRRGHEAADTGHEDDSDSDDARGPLMFTVTAKYAARLGKRKAELATTGPASASSKRTAHANAREKAKARPSSSNTSSSAQPATVQIVRPSGGLIASSTATPSYTAPEAVTAPETIEPPEAPETPETSASETTPAPETRATPTRASLHKEIVWRLAAQFKSAAEAGPGAPEHAHPDRISEMDRFLTYLEETVKTTPEIQTATCIARVLDMMETEQSSVAAKSEGAPKPDDESGGGNEDNEDSEAAEITEAAETVASSRASSSTPAPHRVDALCLPPRDHPIYGDNGIMAGVIISRGTILGSGRSGHLIYRRHPSYLHKTSNVYGDNGHAVGSWWPLQMAAFANGAHGSPQAGIAGMERTGGAHSIVVSGNAQYQGLDADHGDTLFYSGSRSRQHRDPNTFAGADNAATQALVASWKSGKPVRVLRSAPATNRKHTHLIQDPDASPSRWAPCLGIRYDGLYTTVAMTGAINALGGLCERFELRRHPGQTPLEDVRRSSPTLRQREDFFKILEKY